MSYVSSCDNAFPFLSFSLSLSSLCLSFCLSLSSCVWSELWQCKEGNSLCESENTIPLITSPLINHILWCVRVCLWVQLMSWHAFIFREMHKYAHYDFTIHSADIKKTPKLFFHCEEMRMMRKRKNVRLACFFLSQASLSPSHFLTLFDSLQLFLCFASKDVEIYTWSLGFDTAFSIPL